MPNYRNAKIYCIRSHQTDMVYVGSTCVGLSQRMAGHRCNYKRYKNGKGRNTTSFEILKYNNAYIELIENCPCDSKEELLKKEGEYIRSMNCVNKVVAGRTMKEYYQEHKEAIAQKQKQYYDNNKKIIAQKRKQYAKDNKEAIARKQKQYYDNNKKIIAQKRKQKVYCKYCDCMTSRLNLRRHERYKKHLTNFILY
jgi:hypothetical protein